MMSYLHNVKLSHVKMSLFVVCFWNNIYIRLGILSTLGHLRRFIFDLGVAIKQNNNWLRQHTCMSEYR